MRNFFSFFSSRRLTCANIFSYILCSNVLWISMKTERNRIREKNMNSHHVIAASICGTYLSFPDTLLRCHNLRVFNLSSERKQIKHTSLRIVMLSWHIRNEVVFKFPFSPSFTRCHHNLQCLIGFLSHFSEQTFPLTWKKGLKLNSEFEDPIFHLSCNIVTSHEANIFPRVIRLLPLEGELRFLVKDFF